jgi:hypothetical protein
MELEMNEAAMEVLIESHLFLMIRVLSVLA